MQYSRIDCWPLLRRRFWNVDRGRDRIFDWLLRNACPYLSLRLGFHQMGTVIFATDRRLRPNQFFHPFGWKFFGIAQRRPIMMRDHIVLNSTCVRSTNHWLGSNSARYFLAVLPI